MMGTGFCPFPDGCPSPDGLAAALGAQAAVLGGVSVMNLRRTTLKRAFSQVGFPRGGLD